MKNIKVSDLPEYLQNVAIIIDVIVLNALYILYIIIMKKSLFVLD